MPLHGSIDFARRNDMLTYEEIQDCVEGSKFVKEGKLCSLTVIRGSSVLLPNPVDLYPGRATQIRIDLLLGMKDGEPEP